MKLNSDIDSFKSLVDYSEKFFVSIPIENIKDSFYPAFFTITDNWNIARNWLIKEEWDSKWKIHKKKEIANALKPRGILLQKYYKLCERCHGMQDMLNIDIPFKNAGMWFSKIYIELIGLEVDNVLNPPKIYNGNIKKSFLDIDRNISKCLRIRQNPFILYTVNDAQDTLYFKAGGLKTLIDCAFLLKEKSDIFKRDYWNPFLNSYSNHIKEMTSTRWGLGFCVGDKYYLQTGRGRGGTGRVLQNEIKYYKKIIF